MFETNNVLSHVLSPASYDEFFEHILDKRPYFSAGDQNGRKTLLGGNEPKETLLNDFHKYSPTLTCHAYAPKAPPPEARQVESREDFVKLISEYHDRGYTVRIPDVTALTAQLTAFTRELEKVIGNPVHVVAFWSQAGSTAPVHFDEVDLVCLQLVGTKRWFISDAPSRLPNQWKRAGETLSELGKHKTLDVAPGDMIYLPRGTVHTVQSTSESIHLSIGFAPVTVREGINAMVDHFSEQCLPLRKVLGERGDNLTGASTQKQIRDGLKQLLMKCESDDFIDMALRRRRARMIAELPKLSPSEPMHSLSMNSKVKHNPLSMVEMISTSQMVDFCQPGEHILIHIGVEECLRFMKETVEFAVADIPGDFSDDIKLSLVARLLQSGFLQPAASF